MIFRSLLAETLAEALSSFEESLKFSSGLFVVGGRRVVVFVLNGLCGLSGCLITSVPLPFGLCIVSVPCWFGLLGTFVGLALMGAVGLNLGRNGVEGGRMKFSVRLWPQHEPNMNPSMHIPRWVPSDFMHSHTNMHVPSTWLTLHGFGLILKFWLYWLDAANANSVTKPRMKKIIVDAFQRLHRIVEVVKIPANGERKVFR